MNTTETFVKLPDVNVVVSIVKDASGKVVNTSSFTPDMVTTQLSNAANQAQLQAANQQKAIDRLNSIKALFTA